MASRAQPSDSRRNRPAKGLWRISLLLQSGRPRCREHGESLTWWYGSNAPIIQREHAGDDGIGEIRAQADPAFRAGSVVVAGTSGRFGGAGDRLVANHLGHRGPAGLLLRRRRAVRARGALAAATPRRSAAGARP